MKMNSDTASKLIKNLQSEIDMLLRAEKRDCTYSHSPSETPIVPEYSFADTQKRLEELRGNMAALRHAVNRFNIETKVPGFDITVDEALGHMSRLRTNAGFRASPLSRKSPVLGSTAARSLTSFIATSATKRFRQLTRRPATS